MPLFCSCDIFLVHTPAADRGRVEAQNGLRRNPQSLHGGGSSEFDTLHWQVMGLLPPSPPRPPAWQKIGLGGFVVVVLAALFNGGLIVIIVCVACRRRKWPIIKALATTDGAAALAPSPADAPGYRASQTV